jgi:hypothetical protein
MSRADIGRHAGIPHGFPFLVGLTAGIVFPGISFIGIPPNPSTSNHGNHGTRQRP